MRGGRTASSLSRLFVSLPAIGSARIKRNWRRQHSRAQAPRNRAVSPSETCCHGLVFPHTRRRPSIVAMNDPGVDEPISNAAQDLEQNPYNSAEKEEEEEEQDFLDPRSTHSDLLCDFF